MWSAHEPDHSMAVLKKKNGGEGGYRDKCGATRATERKAAADV